MKKILFVNISLTNGGAEKSMVNLLNELPKEQYEVDLLLFRREGMFLAQVPEHVNIIETPRALELLYKPLAKAAGYGIIKIFATLLAKICTGNAYAMREWRWRKIYKHLIPRLKQHYDLSIAYVVGEVT